MPCQALAVPTAGDTKICVYLGTGDMTQRREVSRVQPDVIELENGILKAEKPGNQYRRPVLANDVASSKEKSLNARQARANENVHCEVLLLGLRVAK